MKGKNINSIIQSNCSGCMACKYICPKQAIGEVESDEGFTYPIVDETMCINCGLCVRLCPCLKEFANGREENKQLYLAVKNKDQDILKKSSSGGVFYEVAQTIIQENGAVYGATFDEEFSLSIKRTEKEEELFSMMGSKYLQAKHNYYHEIENDIKEGRKVLFTGTPCEISGLYNYFRERGLETDNLLTMDLLCHGVPSPGIFKQYLNRLCGNKKLVGYTFRNKENGHIQSVKATFSDGTEYTANNTEDEYYRLFSYNLILRESCFTCKYTSYNRPGDITIGDFWGYKGSIPKNNGISLVLVNSIKGAEIWNTIKENYVFEEKTIKDIYQRALEKPVDKPKDRNRVFTLLKKRRWSQVNILATLIRVRNHFSKKR